MQPYVPISYSIAWPGAKPVLGPCGSDAQTEYRGDVRTSSGKEVSLILCFERQLASNGQKLIFYKYDVASKKALGNESYSSEVKEYTKRTINAFVIPKADEAKIESE